MRLPLSQDLWLQWQQHSVQASSPWKKVIHPLCIVYLTGMCHLKQFSKKFFDLMNKYSLDFVSLLFSNLCQELLSILLLLHLRGCLLLCCACMITQSHKHTNVVMLEKDEKVTVCLWQCVWRHHTMTVIFTNNQSSSKRCSFLAGSRSRSRSCPHVVWHLQTIDADTNTDTHT